MRFPIASSLWHTNWRKAALAALLALGITAGCGQKGDLYLPEKAAPTPTPSPAPAANGAVDRPSPNQSPTPAATPNPGTPAPAGAAAP